VSEEGYTKGDTFMANSKNTRRQKDISRLLRERKVNTKLRQIKNGLPFKKDARQKVPYFFQT